MNTHTNIVTRTVDVILSSLIAVSFAGALLFGITNVAHAAGPEGVTSASQGQVSQVGHAIANQGNQALRQIRKESKLSLDQLLLPPSSSDSAEAKKLQEGSLVTAASNPSPCKYVKNTACGTPGSLLDKLASMFRFG